VGKVVGCLSCPGSSRAAECEGECFDLGRGWLELGVAYGEISDILLTGADLTFAASGQSPGANYGALELALTVPQIVVYSVASSTSDRNGQPILGKGGPLLTLWAVGLAGHGLYATLAVSAGATSSLVAQSLGHESFSITEKCYASPVAVAAARQAVVGGELGTIPLSSTLSH
jgi:hypothetical protein